MQKKLWLLATIWLFIAGSAGSTLFAQRASCTSLMNAVKEEADFYDEVSVFSLLYSEFLEEVKAYEYEDELFVIAKFKREPGQIFSKSYIFCGISKNRWNSFKNGWTGTYGERFHQYIIDYVCDCY
ncbi:MAG: hypothetical protein J0M29_00330 [Chitinophagales bacterium]|nr:hypothetical protein [Chitinophagales bacterium]